MIPKFASEAPRTLANFGIGTLDQAIHWYGAQAPGLGNAFLIEVLSAADRITRFPEAWHLLGG